MKGRIWIGTSGWNYQDWRGRFYPESLPVADWFAHYAKSFDTVEINNTFYHLPAARVFKDWSDQAPRGFCYAVKANRYLTHLKKLKAPAAPLKRMLSRVRRLKNHLGPILYQLPPHWHPDLDRLDSFCNRLPKDLRHILEFREREWLAEETYEVLRRHGVGLCIHDMFPRHPRRVTSRVAYVRFHGAGAKYRGSYSRQRLRRWADWIQKNADEGRTVYVYFNNDVKSFAVKNALTLRELVGQG